MALRIDPTEAQDRDVLALENAFIDMAMNVCLPAVRDDIAIETSLEMMSRLRTATPETQSIVRDGSVRVWEPASLTDNEVVVAMDGGECSVHAVGARPTLSYQRLLKALGGDVVEEVEGGSQSASQIVRRLRSAVSRVTIIFEGFPSGDEGDDVSVAYFRRRL